MSRRPTRSERGNALLLVMIVVAVLAFGAATALLIASQDAATTSRRIDANTLIACAEAAEKKLWAEYSLYGASLAAVKPTVIPGTNTRLSIGHFDADPTSVTAVTFNDDSFRALPTSVASGGLAEMDQSNTFRKDLLGQPYLLVAHCTDKKNRQYEVELLVRFGL